MMSNGPSLWRLLQSCAERCGGNADCISLCSSAPLSGCVTVLLFCLLLLGAGAALGLGVAL